MRAGSKSKQPDMLSGADIRLFERPITHDPGTQERRGLLIGNILRHGQDIAGVCKHIFGESAINMETGETRILAEIFLPAAAILTLATGGMQPGNADAHPNLKGRRLALTPQLCGTGYLVKSADLVNSADHLMPRRDWQPWRVDFPFDGMQIRVAGAAYIDLDANLSRGRFRDGQIFQS